MNKRSGELISAGCAKGRGGTWNCATKLSGLNTEHLLELSGLYQVPMHSREAAMKDWPLRQAPCLSTSSLFAIPRALRSLRPSRAAGGDGKRPLRDRQEIDEVIENRDADSKGAPLPGAPVYTTNSDSSFWEGQACCPRLELAAKVDGPCHPRSSCVLGLEVGHASGSNSVRAGDCPVCGGLWRHSLTKSLPSGTGAPATPRNTHRWPGSRVRCDGCG